MQNFDRTASFGQAAPYAHARTLRSRRLTNLRNALLAGAALTLFGIAPVSAQDARYIWNDTAGDGSLFNARNWNPGVPPPGFTYSSSLLANGNAAVGSAGGQIGAAIRVGADTGSASLTVKDGGTLTLIGGFHASINGSVTVTGPNSTIAIGEPGQLTGTLGLSGGTVTVENGGKITSSASNNNPHSMYNGSLMVTGAGSSVQLTNAVGLAGNSFNNQYPSITLANGGSLSVGGEFGIGNTTNGGTGPGTLIVGAAAGSAAVGAGVLSAGGGITFGYGDGSGNVVLNHTATDTSAFVLAPAMKFGGSHQTTSSNATESYRAISAGATIDQIAGVTHVTGASLGFLGATNVSGGKLMLATADSVLGGLFNVSGTGTLGGIGTVGTPGWSETNENGFTTHYVAGTTTINAGGTLSPGMGSTIGTLKVRGDLAFGANSIYAVKIDGNKNHDSTTVDGNVTIAAGAKAQVTALGGQGDYSFNYATPQTFSIIQSTGALTGTFAVEDTAFLTYGSSSDANNSYLTVALKGAAGPDRAWTGTTGNWTTDSNWTPSGAPVTTGAGEAVKISVASGEAIYKGPLDLGTTAGDNTTLTVSGTGKVTLQDVVGPPAQAGTLTIGGAGKAAVKVSGSGASLAAASNLRVNNGSLTVENGAQVSAKSIGGSAAAGATSNILVTGNGSTLTATGTLGSLTLGTFEAIGTLTLADGGTVVATGIDTNGVAIGTGRDGTGTVNIGAAEGQAAAAAGKFNAPTLFFGYSNGTLVFNHTNTDYEFAPAIHAHAAQTGTRDIKQIAGTTRLTADSSGFSGTTTVSGGTLLVDAGGKLGGVFEVSGGVLGGIGTIGTATSSDGPAKTTTISAGTLSPGMTGAIGTLNVAGNLVFGAGSTYAVHFAGDKTSDLTLVDGTVTIADGAKVRATALGGQGDYGVDYSGAGYRYTILTSTGALTGRFSEVQNSAFLNYTSTSDGNNAYLTVALKGEPAATPTKYEWVGGTNQNDWSESANWTPYSPPESYVAPVDGVNVSIAINNGNAVIREAGTTIGNGLTLAQNAGDQANLAITGSGTLQSSTVTVGQRGTAGLTVSGSNAALNATGNITAGSAAGGNGTITIQNGAKVTTTQTAVAGNANGATGNITVAGENSSLSARVVRVGYYGGTGTLTIADKATVSSEIAAALGTQANGSGTLNIGAAAGQAAVGAGTLKSDMLSFGAGTGTLVFNHTDTDYAFNPALVSGTGSATISHLAGVTRMTADSSAFAGITNVSGGTLLVDTTGKLGGVFDVSGTGVLGGIGTIGTAGQTTTISSGTLAPGQVGAVGTLNVAGDLVFGATSTYAVTIAGNKTSDLTKVAGTTTIADGAKVNVTALGNSANYNVGYSGTGYRYTILSSAGGLTGKFTDVQNSAFLNYTSSSDANNAYLNVALKTTPVDPTTPTNPTNPTTPGVFAPVANTPNQLATARALDSLSQGSALWWAVANVPTYDAAREAYTQLSGAPIASASATMTQDSHYVRDAVNDRIRGAFDSVAAPNMAVMSYTAERDAYAYAGPFHKIAPKPAAREPEMFAVWGSAFGSWGKTNSDGNADRVNREAGGMLAGIDSQVINGLRVGLLAGYSRSTFDTANARGSSDSYHAGAYAGTSFGALALRSGLSYTWYDNQSQRNVAFVGQRLDANYKANSFQAFGELGYRIDVSSLTAFEPYANVSYVRLNTDGFRETGGFAALTVNAQNSSNAYTTLGSRVSTTFDLAGFQTTARGGLGWRHAFGDIVPVSTVAFTGSSAFTVSGLPIDTNMGVIEAGLDMRVLPTGTLGISYNGQYGARGSENGVSGRLRVQF
jgi:outer membrane autotransporter protein